MDKEVIKTINDAHPLLYGKKEDCCGCEACSQVCPKGIIQMKSDDEGFFYPHIINANDCIRCLSCEKVCPVKHSDELRSRFTDAYAGWSRSDDNTVRSASGGFSYSLAQKCIDCGYVVYGVSYSNDFREAVYKRAENIDELNGFRGSKYVQARKLNTFVSIRDDLRTHEVVFFGTPCDCYALSRFIKDRSKLTIVALICHGPTSEIIQQSFSENLEKENKSKITEFNLRYKMNGAWKPYYIYAKFDNNSIYCKKFNDTDYNIAFLNFKRPSCESCRFKKNHLFGDILIGDYHGVNKESPIYNEHGVSVMLPLTERGKHIIETMNEYFIYSKVPLRSAISQQAIHSPVKKDTDRKLFISKLNEKGLNAACMSEAINTSKPGFKSLVVSKTKRALWGLFRI